MPSDKLKRTALLLGLGLGAIGLLLFAFLGTYNRYFADDWCYNWDFKKFGLLETLGGYIFQTTYASNRFSLTLFTGLFYPSGVFGVQAMTALAIAAWLIGIFWILHNLNLRFKLTGSPAAVLMISGLALYYFLYLAPHPYQNLHWRAGLLPYTAPMIFGTFLFGLYTHQLVSASAPRWQTALAFTLAFIAGGFSEAANTMLVAGTFLMAAAAYFLKRHGWPGTQNVFQTTLAGFLGAVLAMILLILSPAIPLRMVSYSNPTAITELPVLILKFGIDFIVYFFQGLPLPSLMVLLISAASAILFVSTENVPGWKGYLKSALIIAGIAYLLIAASQAPSAYVEHGLPEARGQYPARIILLSALWAIGGLTGVCFRPRLSSRSGMLLAFAAIAICFAYTARSIAIVSERLPIYMDRAEIWDERNAQIILAREQGITEIDVRGIDSLPVGGMKDLKANPNDWVNVCAARFYGVARIQAVLPGP